MMYHIVVTAEVRIFILENVEAMRAGSHDLLDAIAIHYLNVVHRLHLKKKLVARTSCRIAIAHLVCAESCKSYPCCIQDFGEGNGDTLVTVVIRTCASDPKQNLRSLSFGCHLCDCGYCHKFFDQ